MNNPLIQPGEEEAALLAFDDELARGLSSNDALDAAIRRYPQCARLLIDSAMSRFISNAPAGVEIDLATDALGSRIARRADILLALRSRPGLHSAVRATGDNIVRFAAALLLGKSVLAKLDRCAIDVSTIPRSLVDAISAKLGVSAGQIWAYLSGPQILSAASEYKSPKPPELALADPKKSFAEAIDIEVKAKRLTAAEASLWTKAGDTGPPD